MLAGIFQTFVIMSNFSGQLGHPSIRENEEFILAYHDQQVSQAGKIRNQIRVMNNLLSGRSNVRKGRDLSLSDIALIINASRISSQRFQELTVNGLARNPKSQSKRRSEALTQLKSWKIGEKKLTEKSASYLLRPENIEQTRSLGLEQSASQVQQEIEAKVQADSDIFKALSCDPGQFNLSFHDDEDVPMFSVPENPSLPLTTPPKAASTSSPERNFGIHHSMVNFHIPCSHEV